MENNDTSQLTGSWKLKPSSFDLADGVLTLTTISFSTLVVILCSLCICLFKRKQQPLDSNRILGLDDIPGAKRILPTNLIGNLPRLIPVSTSVEKALKWGKDYPGIFKVTGINKSVVVLNSCQLTQQLFKSTEFGHNVKAAVVYDVMKPFITNGLLVSNGKFWHAQRKVIMRTQSFSSLKAYMGMLNKHAMHFIEDLKTLFKDGKPHEINETINVTFLKIICEMISGYNTDSDSEFGRYHHNFQIWKESIMKRILYPWFNLSCFWKLHPMSRRVNKAIQEMFDFAIRRIKEFEEKRKTEMTILSSVSSATTTEGESEKLPFRCLLKELLDAGMGDDQIVDEVNTMLFGGHETGSTAIHFFCFVMALNPQVQKQCHQEVDELFENPVCLRNGEITYEAVQTQLKYVERCIYETMRIFPPVFIVLRQLNTPLSLAHAGRTYVIPVGANLLVAPLLNHRDPNVFPEPMKFDPDRFLPEQVAKRHPFSFIPFSGGPRNCLGIKFAMLEMKLIAAYLMRNFEITTKDRMADITLVPYTTLTPSKDFTFQFRKRQDKKVAD